MRRLAVLSVALLFLTGCAARINKVMQSWEGAHYSQLIMSWGPPQGVYDDGLGGRILVYTQQRQWVTPGTATTTTDFSATGYDNYIWGQAKSVTQFNPAQLHGYTAYRTFQINSAGRIVNWSWRGL
jgi:hypothetical protein